MADRHTVILHDCKRNREQSWGLEGGDTNDAGVRLLEYSPDDSGKLFLSTSLTGAIQCYSAGKEEVEDVGQQHPSKPNVMAVSPDGGTMISASENPTVVFVLALKTREMARQLHPRVGEGSVVVAAFHPERAKVFLLGFKDGSLVAYDLSGLRGRVGIDVKEARQDLDSIIKELGRFKRLHRMTNRGTIDTTGRLDAAVLSGWDEGTRTSSVGAKSVAITGAAFLPGHKSRAVSVGADGRCRLVEFEGQTVLRTWEAGPSVSGATVPAGVTTISVLGIREREMAGKVDGSKRRSLSHIIAIGRIDGMVLLFDSLGLELQTVLPEETFDKIISVEWIQGPSPRAMSTQSHDNTPVTHEGSQQRAKVVPVEEERPNAVFSQTQSLTTRPVEAMVGNPSALEKPDLRPEMILVKACRGTAFNLPSALKKTNLRPERVPISNAADLGMSGGLPAEDLNTVRYSPIAAKGPSRVRFREGPHADLFSPTQQSPPRLSPRSPAGVVDPLRILTRPRLSSKTFVRAQDTSQEPQKRDKDAASYGMDIPTSIEQHPSLNPNPHSSEYLDVPEPSRLRKSRAYLSMSNSRSSSTDSVIGVPAPGLDQVSSDARRRRETGSRMKSINPALFAPYMNRTATSRMLSTGHGKTSAAELTRSPSSKSTKRTRSPFEPRVSGPMSMTISMDGVNSILSPEPQGTTTLQLNTERTSEETRSSDRDVWLTATASESESESMSPAARRSLVRARLRESIQSPLAQIGFQSVDDTASSSSTILPVTRTKAEDDLSRDLTTIPSRQEAEQPSFNLTPFYPAHTPLFHRTSFNEQQPRQTQTVLSMSDEAMYTATSHMTSDGSFYPASEDIRSIYPRTSSLSPKRSHHRKDRCDKAPTQPPDRDLSCSHSSRDQPFSLRGCPLADQPPFDQQSPYARLNHAAMSNRAFQNWPTVQPTHVSPPPLPAKSPKRLESELQPEQTVVGSANREDVAIPVVVGPPAEGIGVDETEGDREKKRRREKRERRNEEKDKDRRHRDAREAALALLSTKPAPLERGMSRADTSRPSVRSGETMGYFDYKSVVAGRGEGEGDIFEQQEVLMVYPGIGTVDRKYVELVPAQGVEECGRKEKVKTGKDRCKNCRTLLKTKRELQEEVHALQNEVRRLESANMR